MSRSKPGRLDELLASGDMAAAARASRTQAAMAAKLGTSSDAITAWRVRYKVRTGQSAPTFEQLKQGDIALAWEKLGAAYPANENVVAQDSTAPKQQRVEPLQQQRIESVQDRWPNLSAFDETFAANDNDTIKRLTRADCPDGTLILWASDIHIPIHNEAACRVMVECAEAAGVARAVVGGDGLDLNCLSKHAKESIRTVAHSTILEEVEPGRWLIDYLATKETDWLLGNHEDRLKRFIDENPAFHGTAASDFATMVNMPKSINVLDGEVRLGNLSLFHGHREFKNSNGGRYPANKILEMFPDQSSIFGHLHRKTTACRTTRDEDGIHRTRQAYGMPHMSLEHMHYGYVSRVPNWQTGFGLIRVYWEDDRPRWTVYQIEIMFDRRNRPYCEFGGRVSR